MKKKDFHQYFNKKIEHKQVIGLSVINNKIAT